MENLSPSFDPVGSGIAKANAPATLSSVPKPANHSPQSPPRRQTVSSASELPHKDIKAAVFSQHVASTHYIDHHRKAMEMLRHQHREERAAWEVERQELLMKVAELESKITRLQNLGGPPIPSIADKLSGFAMDGGPVHRSASTPGNYYHPGQAKASSNRGLGSLSVDRASQKPRFDPIPESAEVDRGKSVTFAPAASSNDQLNKQLEKELEGRAIPGEVVDQELDGVMMKASGLPLAVKRAILEESNSATPSPLQSPSPSTQTPIGKNSASLGGRQRPVAIEIPSTQQVLQLPARELYTHAAGHTPLARVADGSEEGTGSATPVGLTVVTMESERPPLEPYPSTQDVRPIKPPKERSDSYFNVPAYQPSIPETVPEDASSVADADLVEDPALKGPLSLPSQPSKSKNPTKAISSSDAEENVFLNALQEKLTSLSRQQSSAASTDDDETKHQESTDPPLRIRRSMNFGTQWGKGFAGRTT